MTTTQQETRPPETPPLPAVGNKKKAESKPSIAALLRLHELKILTKSQLEQKLHKYYPEFLDNAPEDEIQKTPPVAPPVKRVPRPPQKSKKRKSKKPHKTKRKLLPSEEASEEASAEASAVASAAAATSPPPPSPPTSPPKKSRRKRVRKTRPGKSQSPQSTQIRNLIRNTIRRRFLSQCINPASVLWFSTMIGRKRNELNKLLFGRAAADLCTILYNENPGPLHHVNNSKLISIIRWQVC